MDLKECITILGKLSNGVHPITGEALPSSSVIHDPTVIRALFHALNLLESPVKASYNAKKTTINAPYKSAKKSTTKKATFNPVDPTKPRNAGKPWQTDDLSKLESLFLRGNNIQTLAKEFGRTELAIAAKLHDMELISDTQLNYYRYPQPQNNLYFS